MNFMQKLNHRNNLLKIKQAREARLNVRFTDEAAIKLAHDKVNKIFLVELEVLRSKNRGQDIVTARNTLMWISYYILNHSMKQIGDFFGYKSHATVSVMLDKVEDWYDTEKPYREVLNDVLFVQYNQPGLTQEV
jgi:chromosomal replication initiation ATPase DnaA